jgi:group I intron endonuclease
MYKADKIFYDKHINLRDKQSLIYLAEDSDGKRYVGQTIQSFQERIKEHIRHHDTDFEKAIDELGIDAFTWEILDFGETKHELNEKEIKYIKELGTLHPNGYNLTSGGKGTKDYQLSDEQKKTLSDVQIKRMSNPKNRKKVSRGVALSHAVDTTIAAKHSELMKKRFDEDSEEGKERRKLASKKQSEFITKDEDNLVEHITARGGRAFFVLKDGEVVGAYLGLATCAKRLGLSSGHIHAVLNGKRKSHKGYTFEYIKSGRMLIDIENSND